VRLFLLLLNLFRTAAFTNTSVSVPQLKGKGNAIPITGREGAYGCETSRLPHFLDSRLTDGSEVVSLTRRSPFTLSKIPGTHFC
jgi:hypothetical protein